MSASVLVTGGAGYIGSHAALALVRAGYRVTIVDNLSNASLQAVDAVRELARDEVPAGGFPEIDFVQLDLVDADATDRLFASNRFDAVMHFAGLKAVGESVTSPLLYYRTNLDSTFAVLEAMQRHEVFRLVFSSSATVYGVAGEARLGEDTPTGATNPYGRTKLMIEQICADMCASDERWQMTMLRYFNPVGADASGDIGEDPRGTPNNLVPFVMQVAVGRRDEVQVYGDDYDTPDGTGVRDYIHVSDLAAGHVAALNRLVPGWRAYNLGTGVGSSVLEVVEAAGSVSGRPVPYRIVGRRAGDVATSVADPTRAHQELGWRAERGLEAMLNDAWRWQSRHPHGYSDASSATEPPA